MADPTTATIRLTEPTVGGDSGTWGGLLNSNFVYIDEAINQSVTISVADTNFTLTADGSSSDQARYLRYNVTGAWTADRTGTLPANVKVGWVTNGTTGGHNLILTTGSGTTLTVAPDSTWVFFQCDGTNVTSPSVKVSIPQAPAASTTQPLRGDQSWQTIATYSPSSASSQAIPLSTSFRRFRMHLQGMVVGTASASLGLQFSADGGVTYQTTGYAYGLVDTSSAGASTPTGTVTGTSISLSVSLPASGTGWDGTFDIYPGGTGLRTSIHGIGFGVRSDSVYAMRTLGGSWDTTAELMNYCKIVTSSGTFSGTIILEGLP